MRAVMACLAVIAACGDPAHPNIVDASVPPDAATCAMQAGNATSVPSTIEAASCLLLRSGEHSICQLGGRPCGSSTETQCDVLDNDYCTPLSFCDCAPSDRTCLDAVIRGGIELSGPMLPHVRCLFPTMSDGYACPGAGRMVAELDASVFLDGTSTTCTNVRVRGAETIGGGFTDLLELETDDFSGTLSVFALESPCKVQLEWKGAIHKQRGILLVDFDLDNGKDLVVPLVFVHNVCYSTPTCTAVRGNLPQETMYFCTDAAPTSSSCQPGASCNGPACGGTCCGVGEACVDGVCRCGSGARCTSDQTCAGDVDGTSGCGAQCQ